MPEQPQPNAADPQGPTPLVQMFPMHIGEPGDAPARPGTDRASPGSERTPNRSGPTPNRAG